jgi:hypothetical protein
LYFAIISFCNFTGLSIGGITQGFVIFLTYALGMGGMMTIISSLVSTQTKNLTGFTQRNWLTISTNNWCYSNFGRDLSCLL